MNTKPEIREAGKRMRAELGAAARAELDRQLVERCRTELDWRGFRQVMVFLPIERQHEINTWPLVIWLWETQPQLAVYAPVILGGGIQAVRITSGSTFTTSRWGIPEPFDGPQPMADEPLDLVFTPLLGFDDSGNRVGYGRGFYDSFLASQSAAMIVGLGYEALKVPGGIPASERDVRLQAVVTEAGFKAVTK